MIIGGPARFFGTKQLVNTGGYKEPCRIMGALLDIRRLSIESLI